ncbi:hypothetical protein [Streptomyces tateyamensis]|uniref:hypothetical protein n=1 Tax=Streptomyces tateyamensis TaxID=565073 RepID=UPI0015E882FE|nr:hypothetical protein [Streptomyces tateyamensis]
MSTVSPEPPGTTGEPSKTAAAEATVDLEGVTSEQVQHAQDENRAEGDPYEDPE